MEITRCTPIGKPEGWYDASGTRYYHPQELSAKLAKVTAQRDRLKELTSKIKTFLQAHSKEVLNGYGGVIGYTVKLTASQTEAIMDEIEREV